MNRRNICITPGVSSVCELCILCWQANAYDVRRLEEPDYGARMAAFREASSWEFEKSTPALQLAVVHNAVFTIKHVRETGGG